MDLSEHYKAEYLQQRQQDHPRRRADKRQGVPNHFAFENFPPTFLALRVNGFIDGQCECIRGKRKECRKDTPGKHPLATGWQREATSSLSWINEWLEDRPHTNLGLRTGPEAGYFVLDLDSPEAIRAAFEMGLPKTWVAKTGRDSGGLHVYLKYPDFRVGQNPVHLGDGIMSDIRGDGNFVMAPGSLHETGRYYEWLPGFSPADVSLADAPDYLIEELRLVNSEKASVRRRNNGSKVASSEGETRNIRLAEAGGFLRRYGASQSEIYEFQSAINKTWFNEPVTYSELEKVSGIVRAAPASHISTSETLSVVRALLERHRPYLPLTTMQFSVLVDGFMRSGYIQNTITPNGAARAIALSSLVPPATVSTGCDDLSKLGLITRGGSSLERGTVWAIELQAIIDMVASYLPVEWRVSSASTIIGMVRVPINLLASLRDDGGCGYLYVPVPGHLRCLRPMELNRTCFTQIAYGTAKTTQELMKVTGLAKSTVNDHVKRLREAGVVITVNGSHSLAEDPDSAIEAAWQRSDAKRKWDKQGAAIKAGRAIFHDPAIPRRAPDQQVDPDVERAMASVMNTSGIVDLGALLPDSDEPALTSRGKLAEKQRTGRTPRPPFLL